MHDAPEPKDFLSPIGTLLAAAIGILGSWIAFVREPRTIKSLEFRLKYVEEQLAQLYGPLLGVLKEFEAAYETTLLALGLHQSSSADPFDLLEPSDPRAKTWKELWHRRTIAYYERVLAIIAKNTHLLGPAPPSSLDEFVSHAGEFIVRSELFFSNFVQAGMNGEQHGVRNREWPVRLTAEVEGKVFVLIALQREYRSRIEGDIVGRRLRRNRFEVEVNRRWRGPYLWAEIQNFIERAQAGKASLINGGPDTLTRLSELFVRETDHPGVSRLIPVGCPIQISELRERVRIDEA